MCIDLHVEYVHSIFGDICKRLHIQDIHRQACAYIQCIDTIYAHTHTCIAYIIYFIYMIWKPFPGWCRTGSWRVASRANAGIERTLSEWPAEIFTDVVLFRALEFLAFFQGWLVYLLSLGKILGDSFICFRTHDSAVVWLANHQGSLEQAILDALCPASTPQRQLSLKTQSPKAGIVATFCDGKEKVEKEFKAAAQALDWLATRNLPGQKDHVPCLL